MNANGKIDLLWSSNNLRVSSGYGQQTTEFAPRLKRAGYGVTIAANYGLHGVPQMAPEGILILPAVADMACNDVLYGHYQYSRADVLITLYDPHAFQPDVMRQMPWCAWSPIDSTPALPANVNALKAARWIWAISRHGERMLHEAGFQNVTYVPHGFDSKVFVPRDRATSRRQLSMLMTTDLSQKFIVAMNSANKGAPSRKGFYEALAAFKPFSDAHADAVLYLHTEQMGVFQGENLPAIVSLCGIDPARVFFCPQYHLVTGMLSNDYLADLYNAADVFLTTSHGEGFGCPVVEAQLCGCPVVVSDGSALHELCMTGRLIPTRPYMPVVGVTWHRPDIGETYQALEWAYGQRGNAVLRNEARDKALCYDADTVFNQYMRPAMERIQADLYIVPTAQAVKVKRIYSASDRSNGKALEADLVHV